MTVENPTPQVYSQPLDEFGNFLDASAEDELTQLDLPPVEHHKAVLGRFKPARDAFGVIQSGLSQLAGKKPSPERVKQDMGLLFATLEQATAVYGFFAGPAVVISLYQSLLRLTGLNPDDAFPNGTWQYYVEYALREDTARHAIETHGFDTALQQHKLHLNPVDRMAAWVMAAIYTLRTYHQLLRNEWRERYYLHILSQVTANEPNAAYYKQLYQKWERVRPYSRGRDAKAKEDYPAYRRAKFDEFLQEAMADLSPAVRRHWVEQVMTEKEEALAAYREQLSILAYLEPGQHGEVRRPISLHQTHIAIVYKGQYYLIPIYDSRTDKLMSVSTIRAYLASIVSQAETTPHHMRLAGLASLRRACWVDLPHKLNPRLIAELNRLRQAPILLNFDQRPFDQSLAQIRQAERGVGDQALTIFDTGRSFVFDLSHIFFDGTWGAAIAEIMTNEALAWGNYLESLPAAPLSSQPLPPLQLPLTAVDWAAIQSLPHIQMEACGETMHVNCRAILGLRRLFKQRSDLLKLTVNDILVTYRAIHALTYQPNPVLVATLQTLAQRKPTQAAAQNALRAIQQERHNPAILMPVDASKQAPRERLHPVSLEVPVAELDLLQIHQKTIQSLTNYTHGLTSYEQFDSLQRRYLATLALVGDIFAHIKDITAKGESTSVGSIKLLAHLPRPIQQLLNKIPERFEVLNDILKGREVFSNVGIVVPGSTLTRFMTAKDDNAQKTLAWGIITGADLQMAITLRDFRPHVVDLIQVGHYELANRITQDYLDSYANGLNQFVHDLLRITLASRETPVTAQSTVPRHS